MVVRSVPRSLGVTTAVAVLALSPARAQQTQPPAFRSGVELVMVDVQVVDRRGQPITALRPDQFEVTIDGKRRQLVSAQLIDAATGTPTPSPAPQQEGRQPRKERP